jgi:hypothetical protein
MSDSASWYQRHFGGLAGRAPQPPAQGSPYYYPQAQPPPQAYYQQQGAPPAYDNTQEQLAALGIGTPGHRDPWAPVPPPPVDTSRIPRGAINPDNFLTLAAFWRGGKGQKEAQHCPRCDGVLFRRFEGQREAAPMCTDCGWNGLWEQGEFAHSA